MNFDEKLGLNSLSVPAKIVLVTVALFLMGLMGTMQVTMSQEKTLPQITFGVLADRMLDVGCSFTHQEHSSNAYPVIVSGPEGSYVQINESQVKLDAVDTEEINTFLYTGQLDGDPLKVSVTTDDGTASDSGAEYENAVLQATWRGVTSKTLVKGYCGC